MLDRKHCAGCRDDFYNGNNPYGVEVCWHRKDAKLVKKLDVHIDAPPPYKHLKPTERPNCYHGDRMVRVDPSNLTSEGYWK